MAFGGSGLLVEVVEFGGTLDGARRGFRDVGGDDVLEAVKFEGFFGGGVGF